MQARVLVLISALGGISALAIGAPACGGATPPAAGASALAGKKPGDVYSAYTAAIGNATAIDEVTPFLSSARKKSSPDLEALKAKVPAGVLKFSEEKVEGDKASLTVEATLQGAGGKEEPSIGAVTLVREDGVWKVDQESWKPK